LHRLQAGDQKLPADSRDLRADLARIPGGIAGGADGPTVGGTVAHETVGKIDLLARAATRRVM
jgi:hypothetical protein